MSKFKDKRVIGVARFVARDKPIQTIGLDTSIILLWMESKFSNYQPNIAKRKNTLFINYIVYAELLYFLTIQKKLKIKKAQNKISSFLKKNNIRLLRQEDFSEKELEQIKAILIELKKVKKNLENPPENNDLEIISIYYIAGVDAIYSKNDKHFREVCELLNIPFENPHLIKFGSQKEINWLFRNAFRKKRK